MSTLATFIQHYTGASSKGHQATKGNKKHPVRKGKEWNYFFADDMILYMENLKESTK